MAAKILLYSQKDAGGLSNEIMQNNPDLFKTGQFKSAEVVKGQWIAYRQADYNPHSWGADNVQVLTEGTAGAVDLKFIPGSIRKVETFGSEGAIVYYCNDYGGTEQTVYDSARTIHVNGASSMIISGGIWTLYTQPEFRGQTKTLGPGLYPTPAAMQFPNDTLASMRKDQ